MAVKDLKKAAQRYEKLFRRPADSIPMPEVAEWKFERSGWLQVYQLPERAGGGSCTLAVSDIDEIVAHLQSLGIDTSQQNSGAKVKTVITDPDGNHLAFAEAIGQGMGARSRPSPVLGNQRRTERSSGMRRYQALTPYALPGSLRKTQAARSDRGDGNGGRVATLQGSAPCALCTSDGLELLPPVTTQQPSTNMTDGR